MTNHWQAERIVLDKKITAEAVMLPGGLNVIIYGGDFPHIGAVAFADKDGSVTLNEFPNHKEGIICRTWAEKLTSAGWAPVVVSAGIHYDGITKEGIAAVMAAVNEMLEQLLIYLKG